MTRPRKQATETGYPLLEMSPLILSLILGIIAGVANIFGGVIVYARPWSRTFLAYFIALGSGFMLATAQCRCQHKARAQGDEIREKGSAPWARIDDDAAENVGDSGDDSQDEAEDERKHFKKRISGLSCLLPRPGHEIALAGCGAFCAGRHTSLLQSRHRSCQVADAHQIVSRRSQSEHPAHQPNPPVPELPPPAHRLHPAQNLLPPLPLLLADDITRLSGPPAVDRALSPLLVLGDVQCGLQAPNGGHELFRILDLVGSHRQRRIPSNRSHHDQRCIPLRGAIGRQYLHVGHPPAALLPQHMPAGAQLRCLARALPPPPRPRVGRRTVRLVPPLLPIKVHSRIARIVVLTPPGR